MSDREDMMQEHGVTRCPDWCIQPADEEQTETHQSELVQYVTNNGISVYLQIVTSWWDGGAHEVIVTTEMDRYGQLHLSIDDWREIASAGDGLVARYDHGGEKWAYTGAQDDEVGA